MSSSNLASFTLKRGSGGLKCSVRSAIASIITEQRNVSARRRGATPLFQAQRGRCFTFCGSGRRTQKTVENFEAQQHVTDAKGKTNKKTNLEMRTSNPTVFWFTPRECYGERERRRGGVSEGECIINQSRPQQDCYCT